MRQVLVSSCALAVPAIIAACGRKESDSTPATNGSTPATRAQKPTYPSTDSSGKDAAAAADSKVSKETAKYQDHPNGDDNCAGCVHFIAGSNTCALVAGTIDPNGWCTFWAGKA